jgi:hypothetical protein
LRGRARASWLVSAGYSEGFNESGCGILAESGYDVRAKRIDNSRDEGVLKGLEAFGLGLVCILSP